MNLKQLKFNNKGILFLFASLAIIVIIVALVNINRSQNQNDIQSFRVIYLNEEKEIYSDDKRYCKFLEMYFDSFTIDTVHSDVVYNKELISKLYPIKVEVSCANNREYVVYLDLYNEFNQKEYNEGFFRKEPALWVINYVENNVFIMPGEHSSKLAQVFKEIYE